MLSTRVWFVGLLAGGLCLGQADPEQADPEQADREGDTYSIYSLLLTNLQTSHGPDGNPRFLVVDTTVRGVPERPCFDRRSLGKSRIAEILSDFDERKNRRQKLKRELVIAKPYELLTESEAAQFRKPGAGVLSRGRYSGVTDLFSFSNVYFDKARTLAVAQVASWCGNVCGLWQWTMLEKQRDGSWKQVPGLSCTSEASKGARGLAQLAGFFGVLHRRLPE
jgi:hypothetical protein